MKIKTVILAAIVYTGFFTAVSIAVYITGSALPLFSFLLLPEVNISKDE